MIQRRNFKKGDIIIQENDFGEEIYILDQGTVEVSSIINGNHTILGVLSKGEIFGEMAVIDEKPRSATVKALEDCHVKVLHRDLFLDVLQMDKDISVKILRSLFSRLRRANLKNMKNIAEKEEEIKIQSTLKHIPVQNVQSIRLEGITTHAKNTLPRNPFQIKHFPFVIGRVTTDPFAKQDLALHDQRPFQISRHHLLFECIGDRVIVTDMGSRLGFQVGEKRFGGGQRGNNSTQVSNGDILIIGSGRSEFQYRMYL